MFLGTLGAILPENMYGFLILSHPLTNFVIQNNLIIMNLHLMEFILEITFMVK